MKVLVTGAGGYIGIPLCSELVQRGHTVFALDRYFFGKSRLNALTSDPRVNVITEDIRDIDSSFLKDVEGVVDLAALSNDASAEIDPSLTRAINFEGGVRLAELAKSAGVKRYVYSS